MVEDIDGNVELLDEDLEDTFNYIEAIFLNKEQDLFV